MNNLDKLGSVFRNKDARDVGINNYGLRKMAENDIIEKINHGWWKFTNKPYDRRVYLQKKYSRTVLSATTALSAWNLVDRNNLFIELTVPQSSNSEVIKREKNVIIYKVKNDFYDIGLTTTVNSDDEILYLYDPERALIDAWRSKKTILRDRNLALKNYKMSEFYDFRKLMEYIKYFPGTNELKAVMEATVY